MNGTNSTNITTNWESYNLQLHFMNDFAVYYSYPLGLFSICSNFMVVISSGLILSTKVHPKSTYMILGNLALADLMHGVILMLMLPLYDMREGWGCVMFFGVLTWYVLECSLSVFLNALDRYVYITHGLYYSRWMTTRRARYLVIATWLISLLTGFIPEIVLADHKSTDKECSYFSVTPLVVMVLASIIGLLPNIITIVLYVSIFFTAQKVGKLIPNDNERKTYQSSSNAENIFSNSRSIVTVIDPKVMNNEIKLESFTQETNMNEQTKENTVPVKYSSQQHVNIRNLEENIMNDNIIEVECNNEEKSTVNNESCNKNKTKSLKKTDDNNYSLKETKTKLRAKSIMVVLLVTATFFGAWGPSIVIIIIYPIICVPMYTELCNTLENALIFCAMNLGLLNALLNPFIYCWWYKGFRKALMRVCFRKSVREKRRNDFVTALKTPRD